VRQGTGRIVGCGDVLQVSKRLDIKVNEKIISWVLENYESFQNDDPTSTWNLVVESMLYDIPDELKPKVFEFYLDQKVTNWYRTNFEIEADTEEEARKMAIKFVEEGKAQEIGWDEVEGVITPMDITDNDGLSTEEIYFEDGSMVYQNGEG
jgi:hypothetical protein